MKKIISSKLLIILATTLLLTISVPAQHGGRIEKEIKFATESNSATVKGTIPNILVGHDYKIIISEGQKLSVKLTSAKNGISFVVNGPDGKVMNGAASVRQWSDLISSAGEYHIIVGSATKGTKPYKLQVTLQ